MALLWYDDKNDPQDRVARAAARYRDKNGVWPTLCRVHPADLGAGGEGTVTVNDNIVRILADRTVLRNHYWIGVEDGPGQNDGEWQHSGHHDFTGG